MKLIKDMRYVKRCQINWAMGSKRSRKLSDSDTRLLKGRFDLR